jgi:hypothetical protein
MLQPEEGGILRLPRDDDLRLVQAADATMGTLALLVAHDLKLFPALSQGPQTAAQVASDLGIAVRPAEALLCVAEAQGFVESANGIYRLTSLAEDYLLPESPTYYGGMLDLRIATNSFNSFDALKRAVLNDVAPAYGGENLFESNAASVSRAETFTRAMHSRSVAAALAWPRLLDLSGNRVMLDVAGGSGAHSIGAALAWPNLRGVIFDMEQVCSIAREYVKAEGLSDRISTQAGDMWRDSLPPADLHFYSNIYHDWPPEKCSFLTQKSFDALPTGGRLVVHEMLYDDDKRGPLETAIYSITMLLWTEGRQYSGRELTEMLSEAGFNDVEVKRSFGLWSIVTGVK